jgi:hypothetical protein
MSASRRRAHCPCQQGIDDAVDPTPRPVITLVHGTWAGHTWVHKKKTKKSGPRSASRLLKRIELSGKEHLLPPQTEDLYDALKRRAPNAHIYRFCWSGGNSNTKRLKAADELRAYLHKLIAKYPEAHHFVVSHSHGGTVSLYAMKDQSLARKITGIISLATPFLHFNRRKFPGYVLYWNAAIFFLSVIVTVTGLSGFNDGGNVIRLISFPSPWWWLAAVVVAAGLIGTGVIFASALLYRGSEFGPASLLGLRNERVVAQEIERLRLPA